MKDTLDPTYLQNKYTEGLSNHRGFNHRVEYRFTSKQRIAIRDDRDGGLCQFPECFKSPICGAECRETATCEKHVHHILAHRYLQNLNVDPDFPENAITIGKQAHDLIHPDIATAKKRYHLDKNAFHRVFDMRDTELERHKIYWVDNWDRPLTVQSIRLTQNAKKRGWEFPEK